MSDPLLSLEHVELVGMILIPMGSGIAYIIWQQAQLALKVDVLWEFFSNHQGMHGLNAMLEQKRNGRGKET